jgi:hypothetical protein
MKLSKFELIDKFPQLNKFKNQKWMEEEAIKHDCNYKELPLKAAFEMINETIEFIEKTKFSNRWEEGFSIKARLNQIKDLLLHFCDDTIEEKALKGENISPLHQQDTTH